MAAEFGLSIVAPDREVLDQAVVSLVAPGEAGYLGVFAGHVPTVVALKPGLVEYVDVQGQRHFVSISGGFVEVTPQRVTVLADSAERAQDIDVRRAELSLENAKKMLSGEQSTMTQEEAVAAIERATNRLKAAKGTRA